MAWEILTLVLGGLFGYLSPGSQPKGRMLLNGILVGLVLAVAFALIPGGFLGLGIFWDIAVLSLLFVLGTWIGDLLEGAATSN